MVAIQLTNNLLLLDKILYKRLQSLHLIVSLTYLMISIMKLKVTKLFVNYSNRISSDSCDCDYREISDNLFYQYFPSLFSFPTFHSIFCIFFLSSQVKHFQTMKKDAKKERIELQFLI